MRSSARRGRQGIGHRVRFYPRIGRRRGAGKLAYLVAEMSANHGGSLDRALRILEAAREAGAAIKLQTWSARTLHDLYAEAATPPDWHPRLK